jgi:hypothetical protein
MAALTIASWTINITWSSDGGAQKWADSLGDIATRDRDADEDEEEDEEEDEDTGTSEHLVGPLLQMTVTMLFARCVPAVTLMRPSLAAKAGKELKEGTSVATRKDRMAF